MIVDDRQLVGPAKLHPPLRKPLIVEDQRCVSATSTNELLLCCALVDPLHLVIGHTVVGLVVTHAPTAPEHATVAFDQLRERIPRSHV